MNAAETSASRAMADCTPLTVVSRSWTTAEIDTFISDVSTTSTNIAIASRMGSRLLLASSPAPATGGTGAGSVIAGCFEWRCQIPSNRAFAAANSASVSTPERFSSPSRLSWAVRSSSAGAAGGGGGAGA